MPGRSFAALAAFALCLPQPVFAQSGYYSGGQSLPIHQIGPDRGGAIGISIDTVTYRCGSLTCVKVIGFDRTSFSGLDVGDYITKVNNISFHTVDDFFGLIRENAPGTRVTIDYWDASNGYTPMYQTAALRGRQSSVGGSLASLTANLETILRTDATHWDVSTYHLNSLRDVRITYVAPGGRDYVVSGVYTYDGAITTNNVDTVDFHFQDNTLYCLRYGSESCRALRTQDTGILAGVIVAAVAALAVAAVSSNSPSQGGYSYQGRSRDQCLQECSRAGDPNPVTEAAMIAQCRARC